MPRVWYLWKLGFFLLGAFIILLPSFAPLGRTPDTIIIDMEVQQNTIVEVFWNEFNQEPRRVKNAGGSRTALEFILPSARIYRLRIDPTQRAEENVIIYGVAIRLPDGSTQNIPLEEIAKWTFISTTPPQLLAGSLTFRSTNSDPYLIGPITLGRASLLETLSSTLYAHTRSNDLLIQLILIGAALAFAFSVTAAASVAFVTTWVAFVAILYFGPSVVMTVFGPDRHDVSIAVGHASFSGLSAGPARWITVLLGPFAAGLGILYGWIFRANAAAPESPSAPRAFLARHEPLAAGVLIVSLTMMLTPDLDAVIRHMVESKMFYHWDVSNVATWAGLIAQGKRPFIDFWYPYNGMWTFDLAIPWGQSLRLLHAVLLYASLGMALWRLLGGRVLAIGLTFALVVILGESGFFPAADRYLISVTLVVTFVAIDRNASSLKSGRVWFFVPFLLALWIEPPQIVYATPGIAIALTVDEIHARDRSLRGSISRLAADFLMPLFGVIGFLMIMGWRGELWPYIEINRQLGTFFAFGLLPTSLQGEVAKGFHAESIGVIAPFILIVVGASALMTARREADWKLALGVLCTATIGILVIQKHLLRPIGTQLLPSSVIPALLLLHLMWNRQRAQAVVATVAGALAVCVLLNAHLRSTGINLVVGASDRVRSTFHVLADQRSRIDDANRQAFSQKRFSEFKTELALVETIKTMRASSLFVLGDLPIVYLFMHVPIPMHMTTYTTSPITTQIDQVAWLEQVDPQIVVVDPNVLVHDMVPMAVRIPLVVEAIIKSYVPIGSVGPYQLLTKRVGDQAISLEFWHKLLGPQIEYGHLLSYVTDAGDGVCPPGPHSCARYLEITFDTDIAGAQPFKMPIEVGSLEFGVSFVRIPGKKSYYIPIDRLWFWRVGEFMGLTPRPLMKEAGATLAMKVKLQQRPILY